MNTQDIQLTLKGIQEEKTSKVLEKLSPSEVDQLAQQELHELVEGWKNRIMLKRTQQGYRK